jgi:mono/diheme cytochrome c family protein
MPIGLITGALVFFLVAIIFKRKQLELSARHASILALVFAVPTILLGVLDWIHFYHAALIPAIKFKIVLAIVVLALLSLGIALGERVKLRNLTLTLIYSLSFVAAVGLGWFGGNLVFGDSFGSAAAAQTGSQAGSASAGSAAGSALFADNCAACHPGGGNSIVASLPVKGSKQLASLAAFSGFLRAPSMPGGKPGDMPAFDAGGLSDAQVKDLYAYASAAFK